MIAPVPVHCFSITFMKRFEQATSYPYGHLVIDLKSDTPEKDRLHTEIFDMAKTMDQKLDAWGHAKTHTSEPII